MTLRDLWCILAGHQASAIKGPTRCRFCGRMIDWDDRGGWTRVWTRTGSDARRERLPGAHDHPARHLMNVIANRIRAGAPDTNKET